MSIRTYALFLSCIPALCWGCHARPGAEAAPPASGAPAGAPDEPSTAGASRPAADGPRLVADCLDVYAGCPPAVGLPAVSADGARVAVPDFGPDSPRDERPLTMRILDVDSGEEVSATPILTIEDYEQGIEPMSGERSPALEAALAARIQSFQRVLDQGGYRPLTALGTVHEDRPGEEVSGLRAVFDGQTLTVIDAREGKVRWRRAIGPSKVWKPSPELDIVCGPFPVADVTVWASRDPGVIVALVTYIGADLCATEYPYLVWR